MIMPANKTSMILTRVRRYVRKDISDAKMDDSLGGVFLVPFQDISVEGVALALAPLPVGDHRCIKALQEQGDQRKDRLVVHLLLGATAGQGVGDGHCVGTHLDESRRNAVHRIPAWQGTGQSQGRGADGDGLDAIC